MRGESTVNIDGKDYPLVITVQALHAVSKELDGRTMQECHQAIVGGEPRTISALISARENADLRNAVRHLGHYMAIANSATAALLELMGVEPGKGDGAEAPLKKA